MSRELHVLHLVEQFPAPEQMTGGAPISIRLQIESLAPLCRVTVLAPRPHYLPFVRYRQRAAQLAASGGEREPLPGVRVFRPGYLHLPLLWPLATPLQLVWLTLWTLGRHAGDATVLHGHRGYPMGFTAVLAAALSGRRSVWTAHGSDVHAQATRGEARVRGPVRWALRHADRVIVVSRELLRIALELGTPAQRLQYIPNGVDPRRFPSRRREDARRALGRDPARRLVVCAALLVPIKGHEILLEAWSRLGALGSDVDLVLLGEGPLRARLEQRVRELGLGGSVCLAGRIPYAQIPEWLAACDLLVLPSLGEGTPLVALEALAAGRPVVGTRVGGTAEVLDREAYGVTVPPGDPEGLAAGLREALERSWDEEPLRRRAEEFAWSRLAQQIRGLYGEVLAGRRS